MFHHIFPCIGNDLESCYVQNLYTVKHYRNVWGTSSILKVINPDSLEKYRWLVNDVTPRLEDLPSSEGYSVSVHTSPGGI
ncbi:hypothetical protein DPMN_012569 [Dreissena polymorpha]|uniref:Uncharacterized protein n=1 Tax=Dreissena polymorpha TaxID=45954 RepID=A0A9D4N620_DREPO|nr:hypothetical protein DPMN_012569 [Dreissena polymorpha]